ncbi:relaxase/mobilization nuclease domain-containing protein [Halodurantibacterium flavum]|uniref:Relaxase/mobilization nuclease domain-containing protein n=1 Tax=Halodurantibacterium flavum TaxID=1382802 RepID=A0ABW4S8U1_9RHOB
MIIKGGSRGGPGQLAAHLQRTDTNERVEVLELHAGTDDLTAAFRDWQTLSEGTRGTKGLYHVNIDPDARYDVTRDQWARAVDVLERELGLQGQPRAVVMHEKKGRQHIHVVWQRTDIETMTLRDDGFNYLAHERASQRLEREFGHEPVPGKHAKRDRKKQPDFPRAEVNHAEWQQAERAGLSVADRRAQIAALKESCDSGAAFKAALAEAGYVLAKGDKRDFVLVDAAGETYSLGRELKMKAAEVRAFMAEVDRDALPAAREAAAMQRARAETALAAPEPLRVPEQSPAPDHPSPAEDPVPAPEETRKPDLDPAVSAALAAREERDRAKLAEWHEAETRQLDYVLSREIDEKLAGLDRQHTAERERLKREQREAAGGIEGFIEALQNRLNPGRGAEKLAERKKEWRQLHARQARERADMEVLLAQDKAEEIAALHERHAQQRREQDAGFAADRQRYAEDAARAERLLRQIEEDRRAREEALRQGRGPEGPPGRVK